MDSKPTEQSKKNKPNVNQMWGCMFAGDLEMKKLLKKKAIIIMGDSRAGKSTLFNHLLKVPMEGVKLGRRDVQLKIIFQQGVEMKETWQSVTLIPNIEPLQVDKELVSLCDTAGFKDQSRGYRGTFGVSYMLQRIFQTAEAIKIMLVVSHAKFQLDQITDIIEPFLNFIQILQVDKLLKQNQNVLKKFFDSISLVIIKAKEDPSHYLGIIKDEIIPFLEKDKSNTNDRQLLLKLLRNISQNTRLDIFKRGEDKTPVDESQIMQNLNNKKDKHNWNYYTFAKNQSQNETSKSVDKKNVESKNADNNQNLESKNIFLLPFKKEFEKLKQPEKKQYLSKIEVKKKFVNDSLVLLTKYLEQGKKNWYQQNINYQQKFKKLRQLIQDQPYGPFALMLDHLNLQLQIPLADTVSVSRMQFIQQLNKIEEATVSINDVLQSDCKQFEIQFRKLQKSKNYFNLFNICKQTFCKTRKQEQQFVTFLFMNVRSLEEYFMQFIIDRNPCSDIPKKIQNSITTILPASVLDLTAQFLISFKPKQQQNQKYLQKLQFIMKKGDQLTNVLDSQKIYYLFVTQKIKSAKKTINKGLYLAGLKQLMQANDAFQQYIQTLGQLEEQQDQIKQKCQFKQLQIYNQIGRCLEKLDWNQLALNIYQHLRSANSMIVCYQRMIKGKKSIKTKIQLMQDYAEILEKYGKKHRLISLYQQMIDISICYPKKRRQLMQKLASALGAEISTTTYEEQLGESHKIENLASLIEQINTELEYGTESNLVEDTAEEDLDALFLQYFNKMNKVNIQHSEAN